MGGAAAAPYLAAALGGGASSLGAIFAPEGQELDSFQRSGVPTTPVGTAQDIGRYLESYLGMALKEAGAPVTSNTTVAPLPAFSGGGLPFDISAPAVDPNRMDASRRTIPGFDIPGDFGDGEAFPDLSPGDSMPGQPPYQDPDAPEEGMKPPYRYEPIPPTKRTLGPPEEDGLSLGPPRDDAFDVDFGRERPGMDENTRRRLSSEAEGYGLGRRPGQPNPLEGGFDFTQPGGGAVPDLDQAEGAIALLMQQLERKG